MVNASEAIQAALDCDWLKAIKINTEILKENPNDINALNRLGFAYLKCADLKEAKKTFEKVLKIDPFNPIALKNLKKLKGFCLTANNKHYQKISPDIFLEEPGITKTVNLVNIADKKVLSLLNAGEKVLIVPRKNRIEIRTQDNVYLGVLPDDLSFRLKKLIRLGNAYCAFIKAVDNQEVTVIIREIKRSKRVKDASFLTNLLPNYHASIRSELVEEFLEESESEELEETSFEEEEE